MSNYSSSSGTGGAVAVVTFVVLLAISFLIATISHGSSSSSSYDDYEYYSAPSYDDYDVPDYGKYDDDDRYDYAYEEPEVTSWDCVDATSYDKNPYNDNYCVSSDGQSIYTTDSQAESLDPYYTAGTSGHPYYNSF